MFAVEDNVLSHSVRQLTPAKVGGSVVLRCEISPQIGLVDIRWIQDGLTLSSSYIGGGMLRKLINTTSEVIKVDYIEGYITDSRWISGAGGFLLGVDLTQADMQAEYSCIALDTPSPIVKLTTDGEFNAIFRYFNESYFP